MSIEIELQEIKEKVDYQREIDIKLLKKVAKFLGAPGNPARDEIDLKNKVIIKRIREKFLIAQLNQTEEEAKRIIKKVKSYLKGLKFVYRAVFYYLILEEMNSPEKRLPNIHPGEILEEEFLKPMGISAYKLSKDIGVPQNRISLILSRKRGITADTALRFSKYFGTSSKFWLGLQNDYDLEESQKVNLIDLVQIKKCA